MAVELPYEQRKPIEQAAQVLLEDYGIRFLPFNPGELARAMGIKVVDYRKIAGDEKSLRAFRAMSDDGFSWVDNDRNRRFIFYDSARVSGARLRFTIAHEIGHIWLEHPRGDCLFESQAEYFAGYLLAPHPIIIKLNLQIIDIQQYLQLSAPAAKRAYEQARERVERWRADPRREKGDYELWIVDNLQLSGC